VKPLVNHSNEKGFTLMELMIAVVIVGILAAIALPSYKEYVKKASRAAAQTELLDLASIQEKIFLNSNSYSASITAAYTGNASGGLGRTSGRTNDGKYDLSIVAPGQTYTITATPVAGTTQAGDGNLTISENGQRLWGSVAW
jgi:type IV pilus assembly protein PilE